MFSIEPIPLFIE